MNTGMTARPPRLRVAEPVASELDVAVGHLSGEEGTAGAFSRTYPGRPDQAGAARAFVREVLPPGPVADDVVLAASELITNAITHSRSGVPGGLFTVRVRLRPGRDIRVEVDDEGGHWEVRVCDHEHGRGLTVIAALAGDANWGVAGNSSARTVWVRFGWMATVQKTSSQPEPVTREGEATHG